MLPRTSSPKTLTFLASAKYVDFLYDADHEEKYAELIHDIHGQQIQPAPPLGPNPFTVLPRGEVPNALRTMSARYVSQPLPGGVSFDYTNIRWRLRDRVRDSVSPKA